MASPYPPGESQRAMRRRATGRPPGPPWSPPRSAGQGLIRQEGSRIARLRPAGDLTPNLVTQRHGRLRGESARSAWTTLPMSPGSGPATQIAIIGVGEPPRASCPPLDCVTCAVPRPARFQDQQPRSKRSPRGCPNRHPPALIAQRARRLPGQRINRARGPPCSPRRRSLLPRLPAAARCALGLSPGGLPGRLITIGAGTLLLSLGVIRAGRLGRVRRPGRVLPGLGFGLGRPGLRADFRVVLLLPRRSWLLLPGPRLLLGG